MSMSHLTTKNDGGIPVSGWGSPLFVSTRQILKFDSFGRVDDGLVDLSPSCTAMSKHEAYEQFFFFNIIFKNFEDKEVCFCLPAFFCQNAVAKSKSLVDLPLRREVAASSWPLLPFLFYSVEYNKKFVILKLLLY